MPSYSDIRNDQYFIPEDQLVNGRIYEIVSRNLYVGVWDSSKRGFIGIREKFDSTYLFTEYEYATGSPFGTARAFRLLDETLPEGMAICENFEPYEKETGKTVRFTKPISQGGEGWIYTDTLTQASGDIIRESNTPLYNFLMPIDKEISIRRNAEWQEELEAYRKQADIEDAQ